MGPRRNTYNASTPLDADSLADLLDSWELALRSRNRSDKTIYSYRLSATKLIRFLEDQGWPTEAQSIGRGALEAFLADQVTHWSPSTAGVRYRSLQQLFRWLLAEGEIERDPMATMEPPNVPEVPVPIVTDDQIRRLASVCSGPAFEDRRDSAILWTFVDSGCQLAEVTQLALSALDLRAMEATVTGKGSRVRVVPFVNAD